MQIIVPRFSRRCFLRAMGGSFLLAGWPSAALAQEGGTETISILHTTDLHGHILPTSDYDGRGDLGGLARCATQIRQWQRENPRWALIDVGDVYQGTEPSLATQGDVMIQLLNTLHYDAWVVGNHDFDWGPQVLAHAVEISRMPVLSANARVSSNVSPGVPSSHLQPYLVKEVAGFRLVFIGLTTPGLASWLPPEKLSGFEVLDPVETLQAMMPEVASLRPDAVILAGHMGLTRRDDFANRIGAVTQSWPHLAVCLGGHTHQNHPGEIINNVLYTQANHFGIHAGKVDLIFDRGTRRLLRSEATTVEMNHELPLDAGVLAMAQPALTQADRVLNTRMGELTEAFGVASRPGNPSDVERLIGSAMQAALQRRGVEIDLVAHGLFESNRDLSAGPKTIADAWDILPYENEIVTLDLTRRDLLDFVRDLEMSKDRRSVMGLKPVYSASNGVNALVDLRSRDGSPLPERPRYRVALNSYDSQSGGQRLLRVAQLARNPENRRILHPIQIRQALIDFFVTRQRVGRSALLV